MERSLPRNESSTGANVPWNESSTGAKVLSVDFSLPGTKLQRNEKAWNQILTIVSYRMRCESGLKCEITNMRKCEHYDSVHRYGYHVAMRPLTSASKLKELLRTLYCLGYSRYSVSIMKIVMDDFKISKLDRFRFDFLKKI